MSINTSIPENTSHVFINTKNKKSFYSNRITNKDGWCIFNKGLGAWEKVPSMDLDLIEVEDYLKSSLNSFTDVDEESNTTIVKVNSKTNSLSSIKEEFRTPPVTMQDLSYIQELFEKHSKTPLGFIPKEANFTVIYNHTTQKWSRIEEYESEGLTFYTQDLAAIQQILKHLNTI